MTPPLKITWVDAPITTPGNALNVRIQRESATKMLSQAMGEDALRKYSGSMPIPETQTIAELWIYLQRAVVSLTNYELDKAQQAIVEVKQSNDLQIQLHQEAITSLSIQLFSLRAQLQTAVDEEALLARDKVLETMDWQPTQTIELPPYGVLAEARIGEGIRKGTYQRAKGKTPSGKAASLDGTASEQLRDEDARTPYKEPSPRRDPVAGTPARDPWAELGLDYNEPAPPETAPAGVQLAFYKRRALIERIRRLEQQARGPSLAPREGKSPDPKSFKGEPEDLERFLTQLDNKFSLSALTIRTDLQKIQYAANLLEGSAARWYETYHLKISSEAAARRGITFVPDLKYEVYKFFEEQLRASFGSRLTRDQAVLKWRSLQHSGNIDNFLDEFIRLKWLTGYEGQEVEDKLSTSLNYELGKQWASIQHKPQDIMEQVHMVRGLGHSMERFDRNFRKRDPEPKKGKVPEPRSLKDRITKKPGESGGSSSGKGDRRGPKKEKREWKDKEKELAGIPKFLLDKRSAGDQCLRCGGDDHRWPRCTRPKNTGAQTAASSNKRKTREEKAENSASKKTRPDEATAASLEGNQPPGRLMEVEEEDLDLWEIKGGL